MFGFQSHRQTGNTRTPSTAFLSLDSLETRETPAIITAPDNQYTVFAGQVLTVSATKGVLANDFSDNNPFAILAASQTSTVRSSAPNSPALPSNTLTFNANGSFTLIAPSDYNPNLGPIIFDYKAVDLRSSDISAPERVTINIVSRTTSTQLFATGSGPGVASQVNVYESSTGLLRYTLFPYETSFTGGVRVATGDVNSDGVADIITSPAFGGSARIRIFDGASGVGVGDYFAFNDPNFRGGAEIAIGDIDGDQLNDVVVGAGPGGGPRVQVYNLAVNPNKFLNQTVFADFFAYESTFRNGVRVAAGNTNDLEGTNKRDFLVTGAGPGGGPLVKVFDGRNLFNVSEPPAVKAFFAYDSTARGGVNVAVGQFRGDGAADIVAASGTSDVFRVFDGRSLAMLRERTVEPGDGSLGSSAGSGGVGSGSSNFGGAGGLITAVGSGGATGGIRVSTTDRNGDGLSDIITGAAGGQLPRVRIFDGNSFIEQTNFLAYPSNFLGGVFVGGNSL
jgi:hypothetical protein